VIVTLKKNNCGVEIRILRAQIWFGSTISGHFSYNMRLKWSENE
jgi:hypothetical protein